MGTIIRKTMDEIRRERTESDRQLAMMEDVPDDQIDFSDIPASTDEDWKNAVRGRFYEPLVAVDADVISWLKRDGECDVRAKMNAVLREAMLRDVAPARKRA
jgi:uncharacterized protein (DUF4415 family)